MPSNLSQRIKEIVLLAKGNRSQAERLIREAIVRDHEFLRQLVDPFLPGIIASALAREIKPVSHSHMPAPKPLSESGMDALLRGLNSKANTPAAPAKPAGTGHADTIRALAEAQRQKRGGN